MLIERIFNRGKQENLNLALSLNTQMKVTRESSFISLFKGNLDNYDENSIMEMIGFSPAKPQFILMYIIIDNYKKFSVKYDLKEQNASIDF